MRAWFFYITAADTKLPLWGMDRHIISWITEYWGFRISCSTCGHRYPLENQNTSMSSKGEPTVFSVTDDKLFFFVASYTCKGIPRTYGCSPSASSTQHPSQQQSLPSYVCTRIHQHPLATMDAMHRKRSHCLLLLLVEHLPSFASQHPLLPLSDSKWP